MTFRRVLVLEDNFIIAMEAEDILRSIGVADVTIATNVEQAETLLLEESFDFVLLDVNLGAQTSFLFAEKLLDRRIPFGFVSGYGEDSVFPLAFRAVPRITKPFNEDSIGSLLSIAS
ncbi:regulator [Pararhizobium antarcticum]|uniref:Regulator n=2 Tax=Pararhizobium antarcticum TaxID=1798805 RepID=A0A657LUV8_9HYPH|nr:response regulator [Pararhizobium antarcticum]OJF97867.1 regulator [Rhizobium sp. 58]OJF98299.1 regulator [Pararhizobium antarcticum]